MSPQELRTRALQEAIDLGPRPDASSDRSWHELRRGSVILLSYLADRDAALLRRAAIKIDGEWVDPVAQDLLLDAAQEC